MLLNDKYKSYQGRVSKKHTSNQLYKLTKTLLLFKRPIKIYHQSLKN